MRQVLLVGVILGIGGLSTSCGSSADLERETESTSDSNTDLQGDEPIDFDSYKFVLKGYCTAAMIGTHCDGNKYWCGPPGPACKCKSVC